jgi:hypothetical protein
MEIKKGMKFEYWTILFPIGNGKILKNGNRHYGKWFCRCNCGLEKNVYTVHLLSGHSTKCRKCSEGKFKYKIPSTMLTRIRWSAQLRNIEINLGSNREMNLYLYSMLNEQKFCCALSGLPISIAFTNKENKRGSSTASLDRIDSSKGYIPGNVQWVHKDINKLKMNLSENKLIELCEIISTFQKNKKIDAIIKENLDK